MGKLDGEGQFLKHKKTRNNARRSLDLGSSPLKQQARTFTYLLTFLQLTEQV